MANPLCVIRFLWRSFMAGAWMSGHDYQTDAEPTPPNVHVLVCRTCGHNMVSWAWHSLEDQK